MRGAALFGVLVALFTATGCTTVQFTQTGPPVSEEWRTSRNPACRDDRNRARSRAEYMEIVQKAVEAARAAYPEVFSELDRWNKEQNERMRAFLAKSQNSFASRPEEYGIGAYHARVGMPKEILRVFYCEPNQIRQKPGELNADEVWEYRYASSRYLYFIKDGKINSIEIITLESL